MLVCRREKEEEEEAGPRCGGALHGDQMQRNRFLDSFPAWRPCTRKTVRPMPVHVKLNLDLAKEQILFGGEIGGGKTFTPRPSSPSSSPTGWGARTHHARPPDQAPCHTWVCLQCGVSGLGALISFSVTSHACEGHPLTVVGPPRQTSYESCVIEGVASRNERTRGPEGSTISIFHDVWRRM